MAAAAKAFNVPIASHLPLRRPSVAPRDRKDARNIIKARTPRSGRIEWDLDSLQAVRSAADRVRQSHDAWQQQVSAAEGLDQLERQQRLGLFHAERERRDATQRAEQDERAAQAAEEQRLIAEAREIADQVALAAEAARLAEEDERRQLEAEQRRVVEEERRRAENEIALNLVREEEDRRRRIIEEERRRVEDEIAMMRAQEERGRQRRLEVEAARRAEEANRRKRAQEEGNRRTARLRDCAACLEQHDLAGMVQVACEHWYCHEGIDDAIVNACAGRRPFQCCQQTVSANQVRAALAPELFARYNAMVEEHQEANPVYCSRRSCAVFLPARLASGPDEIECTQCGHSTCRHCKGRSHAGTECVADVGAQQARALAGRKGWKECPRCRSVVEKSSGCMHMTCRCGTDFCYRCGRLLSQCGDRCRA